MMHMSNKARRHDKCGDAAPSFPATPRKEGHLLQVIGTQVKAKLATREEIKTTRSPPPPFKVLTEPLRP